LTEAAKAQRTVVVLADDLIWATRLSDAIGAAGARPVRVRRLEDLGAALSPAGEGEGSGHAIIDLTARAYDGIEAIRTATSTGARVVAVGQHDDAELRRAALEAGAERVFTYRALFEHGPRTIAAWLAR
jgi:DNA-binding NarL/FixJ family response regulator